MVNKGWIKKKQHLSPSTEFKQGENLGDKNHKWKGDKVGYFGLHLWVRRKLRQPVNCQSCFLSKPLDLSNISGEYKRDLSDWQWLCKSCHMKYDITPKRIKHLRSWSKKAADIRWGNVNSNTGGNRNLP